MSIISSLDSQSFLLTRKLLMRHASVLAEQLERQSSDKYPLDEVTIELELETINSIIHELMSIGEQWLKDSDNEFHNERKQILAYVLKQWVKVGQDAKKLTQLPSSDILH